MNFALGDINWDNPNVKYSGPRRPIKPLQYGHSHEKGYASSMTNKFEILSLIEKNGVWKEKQ